MRRTNLPTCPDSRKWRELCHNNRNISRENRDYLREKRRTFLEVLPRRGRTIPKSYSKAFPWPAWLFESPTACRQKNYRFREKRSILPPPSQPFCVSFPPPSSVHSISVTCLSEKQLFQRCASQNLWSRNDWEESVVLLEIWNKLIKN